MGKGPQVPQSSIDAQVNLQKTEADLLNKYSGIALPGLKSSTDYWTSILKGGPQAQAAVAPYAANITANAATTTQAIQNNMSAGGEKELALSRVPSQTAGQVASLYAGMQPTAASALGNLALGTAGAGTGSGGVSANAGAANEQLAGQQAQAKAQMVSGIAQGVGTAAGGYFGNK